MSNELAIRTDERLYFTGKKIRLDPKTGFASLVSLVKAVCKNDHDGYNSKRFWGRLKPELEKKDYRFTDQEIYLSPVAVNKLAETNIEGCKKSWAVFYDDGLDNLLEDMGCVRKKRRSTTFQDTPSSSNKKGKTAVSEEQPTDIELVSTKEFLFERSRILNQREKELNDREVLITKREFIVSTREKNCTAVEEELNIKADKLTKLEKRLTKKQQSVAAPDVTKFIEQMSSLANQFKAKVSRSRRNSSEEPMIVDSKTPSDVSEQDGVADTTAATAETAETDVQRSPSRSPSLIGNSNDEVRQLVCLYFLVSSFTGSLLIWLVYISWLVTG